MEIYKQLLAIMLKPLLEVYAIERQLPGGIGASWPSWPDYYGLPRSILIASVTGCLTRWTFVLIQLGFSYMLKCAILYTYLGVSLIVVNGSYF